MYYHQCHEAKQERLGEVMVVQNSGIKKGWNPYGQLTVMGGQKRFMKFERGHGPKPYWRIVTSLDELSKSLGGGGEGFQEGED